jgi:DNA-binding response OmpR family regulator
MAHTVLLVEDNPHIKEINKEAFTMEGYNCLCAGTVKECLEMLKKQEPDIIVLDIMLPDGDGVTLCKKIKADYSIPIIFLSALGENEDVINGLRSGGDDYLSKPYDIRILLARVEARLRAAAGAKRVLKYGQIKIDTGSELCFCNDMDLCLTRKEYLVLLTLVKNVGQLISKDELYKGIWGADPGSDLNALYTTVSRLNKKLDKAGAGIVATTSHREGYTLEKS